MNSAILLMDPADASEKQVIDFRFHAETRP